MNFEQLFARSYYDETVIHPLGLLILVALIGLSFVVNRRSVIVLILIMSCFIAPAQRIVVFGLDFNFIRLMILAGWIRIFYKNENDGFIWLRLDKFIIAWAISSMIAYIFLRGTFGSVIYKFGTVFDTIGIYLLFRCLLQDINDVKYLLRALVYLSLPVAGFLLIEKITGRNFFSVFGGVPELTAIRHGNLRAQGAFAHPILAGSFWASQLPLFIALWWSYFNKLMVAIGVIAILSMVYACASSTPLVGIGAVMLGFGFFVFRNHMNLVRWAFFAAIAGLHFAMKGPVWHLISRLDLVGGSTGYHRYNLVNQFIQRVDEWWLLGTTSTAHWGWFLFDTANMYVNEGVRGGLLTLILFALIIVTAFQGVGRIMRNIGDQNRADYILAWALGVSLFTHCMMFISVAYFGQIIVVWYLLLATIANLSSLAPFVEPGKDIEAVVPGKKVVLRW